MQALLALVFVGSAVWLLLFTPATRLVLVPLVMMAGSGASLAVRTDWHRHTKAKAFLAVFATIVAAGSGVLAVPQLIQGKTDAPQTTTPPISASASPSTSSSSQPSSATVPTPNLTAPSSTSQRSDLIVEQVGWPMFPDCDGATQVAALPGQPAPGNYNGDSGGKDVRAGIIKAGGAAWETGYVTLALSAPKGETVHVVGIDTVVYKHSEVAAAWVWAPYGGGCGESDARRYGINFDAAHPSVFSIPHAGEKHAHKFGQSFVVKANDPVSLEIWAEDCTSYTEWGLRINYTVGGEEGVRTVEVNNPEHPYRSVGGQAPAYVNTGNAYTNKMTRDPGSDRSCDPQVDTWEQG